MIVAGVGDVGSLIKKPGADVFIGNLSVRANDLADGQMAGDGIRDSSKAGLSPRQFWIGFLNVMDQIRMRVMTLQTNRLQRYPGA